MRGLLFLWLTGVPAISGAQQTPRDPTQRLGRFSLESGSVVSSGPVRGWASLVDQGARAAVHGHETGGFDVWVWPARPLRDVELAFRIPPNEDAIAGASIARQAIARPEGTTVVYSHPRFTVRQHVFVPLEERGVIMLLEVESVGVLDIHVRIGSDAEVTWNAADHRFDLSTGGVRGFEGFVGSPLAVSGVRLPRELSVRFDPAIGARDYIVVAMAASAESRDSADAVYRRLLVNAPALWRQKVEHYRRIRQDLLSLESPDTRLNHAFEWAKVQVDRAANSRGAGAASLAGGFGLYFGANAAVNSLAQSAIGQFGSAREALSVVAKHQRADGKVAHDVSTPFWLIACHAYWAASGDEAFLRQYWPNIARAFRWALSTDSDGDGLMESALAGPSAFEFSGVTTHLRTDLYLGGVWVAALEAVQELARAVADGITANAAAATYAKAQQSLEEKFWVQNAAVTFWPAVALSFGVLDDDRAERALREIGSTAITADWGVRMLSRFDASFDPVQFYQGGVVPFATAFAALAHYRHHRAWAGHDLIRDLARTTFDFGRGYSPPQLSGSFYIALGAIATLPSTSSMLVNPLIRGLLGLTVDAPNRALAIEPHLPPEWNGVSVNDVAVGRDRVHLTIRREAGKYNVTLRRSTAGPPVFVRLAPALPPGSVVERVRIGDRDYPVHSDVTAHDVHPVIEVQLHGSVEIEIDYTGGVELQMPAENLEIGDGSTALRVLDFRQDGRDYILLVEGLPSATYTVVFRTGTRLRSALGAEIVEQTDERAVLRVRLSAAQQAVVRREIRIRT